MPSIIVSLGQKNSYQPHLILICYVQLKASETSLLISLLLLRYLFFSYWLRDLFVRLYNYLFRDGRNVSIG